MILRRLRSHIQAENWFAVAIDFAIVVVGVFIGLQVANWNAARADDARGERLMERLRAEFMEIEAEHLHSLSGVIFARDAAMDLEVAVAAGQLDPDSSDLPDRLGSIDYYRIPHGPSSTFSEIVSQGDMDLMQSPGLRDALTRYDVVANRHLQASASVFASIGEDVLKPLIALTALPRDDRSERYRDEIAILLGSPYLYTEIMDQRLKLENSLFWFELSRVRVCEVLVALGETCRPSPISAEAPS
ncbi:MAG: hypothetical protein AAF311_04565 [Pseudomonadota bacterium]